MDGGVKKRLRHTNRCPRNWTFWKHFGLFFLTGNLLLMLTTFMYYISKDPQHVNVQGHLEGYKDWSRSSMLKIFNTKDTSIQYHDQCFNDIHTAATPIFTEVQVNSLFVLSPAFYENRVRGKSDLLMFALGNRSVINHNTTIYCILPEEKRDKDNSIVIRAEIKTLRAVSETHAFQGYRITCQLPKEISERPCKMYISQAKDTRMGYKSINVLGTKRAQEEDAPWQFGICVPPLHGVITFSHLVEYVEMSQLLGSDKIIFYRYMGDNKRTYSNPNIDQVLDYYSRKESVIVHPWKLPVAASHTWDQAQILAMQHCLYTTMITFKHLLFLEIDQFLIPRQDIKNLTSLLRVLELKYGKDTVVYKFRTAFFPPEVGELLEMVRSIRRTTAISKKYSKIIIDPQFIKEVGPNTALTLHADNHGGVRGSWGRSSIVAARVDYGLVHHYRQCDNRYQTNCYDYTTDDTALNFATRLEQIYKATIRDITMKYSSVQ